MVDVIPELKGLGRLSSDGLRAGLQASLRTPKASKQSLTSPLEIRSINWKAVDARELMEAIGIAYAQDRMRAKVARAERRAEDRAIERELSKVPKVANKQRRKVRQAKRMAMDGLFKRAAQILGMKQQKLY